MLKRDFHVIIDNGHGDNTPGKCSPDKSIREYAYCRNMAKALEELLINAGYSTHILVPEQTDISLKERCKRANALCLKYGAKNCILISLHLNAYGSDGQWHGASGWCDFVSLNASAKSKTLAACITEEMLKIRTPYYLRGGRCVPKELYWTQNLAICRDTNCPAVLTENLFQDCKADADFLKSDVALYTLSKLHLDGINSYFKKIYG